ncbi:MAG: CtsR family transcriptional regulator [Alicyclobacillaceae bacterium]|nr:CtsR family transcriptional regulator [Alicyclobacillaceae bacterium]
MARNVSDIIEQHLKDIIRQSQSGVIELQRSELAELFQCVPSQINYVINTRFSLEHGYVVESKRGGGGYIRIRQIQFESEEPLVRMLQSIGDALSQREAEGMIERLERESLITGREAGMLRAAVSRDVLRIDLPFRDQLRARLLTQMLTALFFRDDDGRQDEPSGEQA